MKTITIYMSSDENGPMIFDSSKERLAIIYCPKNDVKDFSKEIGINFDVPGVYILYSDDSQAEKKVYIGESDSIIKRLAQHKESEEKDFAQNYIFVISKDILHPLEKGQIRYLERKLIDKFKKSDYKVANGNSGQGVEPTKRECNLLDEELSFIEQALSTYGLHMEKSVVVKYVPINTSLTLKDDHIEVYATIPKTDIKVNAIYHSDGKVTILKGQSWEYRARSNDEDISVVKRSISNHIGLEGVIVEGDETSYKVSYVENVTYRSLWAAIVLIKGGIGNRSDFKQVSNGIGIEKLAK